jgi:hypothetical protein
VIASKLGVEWSCRPGRYLPQGGRAKKSRCSRNRQQGTPLAFLPADDLPSIRLDRETPPIQDDSSAIDDVSARTGDGSLHDDVLWMVREIGFEDVQPIPRRYGVIVQNRDSRCFFDDACDAEVDRSRESQSTIGGDEIDLFGDIRWAGSTRQHHHDSIGGRIHRRDGVDAADKGLCAD